MSKCLIIFQLLGIKKVCVFLAVAIISVVYAASLTAPKEKSDETVNNRFLELLYTANTSRKIKS